jgi:taurine dioxygenase
VPASGGETYFANGHLAYEALPARRRAQLDGLAARYSWNTLQRWLAEASGTWEPMSTDAMARHPDVVRPLVRVHPVTGRKALFFSIEEIVEITGLDRFETRALLEELVDHLTTTPHVVLRHDWSVGDIVVWDNRCLMHSVCEYNYEGQRRLLHQLNGADARSADQTIAVIPVG